MPTSPTYRKSTPSRSTYRTTGSGRLTSPESASTKPRGHGSWLSIAGADQSQITAAGDSYNDVPLLKAAGLRIAMGDAPDELLALADYIAPPVEEDGLAVAIEEFVLPRLDE